MSRETNSPVRGVMSSFIGVLRGQLCDEATAEDDSEFVFSSKELRSRS